MAAGRTVLDSDEQTYIEIDGQAQQWLDDSAVPGSILTDHVEDHSQRELVAVFVRQGY